MSKTSTLFDEVYVLAHKHPDVFKPELLRQLKVARRFVLDEGMSAFLADIGWAAFKKEATVVNNPDGSPGELKEIAKQNMIKVMEDVRHLARLPHAVTWIEWDEIELASRAYAFYGSSINPDLVPRKSGWLLIQHPHIETAFRGLSFGIGSSMFGSEGKMAVGITPFSMTWRADDEGPIPWHSHPLTVDADNAPLLFRGASVSGVMTGMGFYHSHMIGLADTKEFIPEPQKAYELKAYEFRQMLNEHTGMARYVLGLLATINDLPVGIKHVTASKGFVAKGNYKRFLDHNVITLKVPQDQYRAIAQKAVAGMHRRAHQVRGHFRENWRKPGEKIWVHEHVRGDASRGFVLHDYAITKGTGQ